MNRISAKSFTLLGKVLYLMSVAVLGKKDELVEWTSGIYFPKFLIKLKIVLLLFCHLIIGFLGEVCL